jgi:hypothetical protein
MKSELAKAVTKSTSSQPKPKVVVYQVVGCNLDVETNDKYPHRTWANKDDAKAAALAWFKEVDTEEIEYHDAKTCLEFKGKSTEYSQPQRYDSYYGISHYGSYRVAVYINEIEVW